MKSQTINPPTKEQFLEDLVRYEMGVQEAEKRNLQKDPIVQDRFNQEMYKALLEKDIGQRVQKIQVSDAEMKAWYAKNPELRTSHILIEFKAGATPAQVAEAKKRATEIYEEVKKSKRPFEELVKLYSDDALSKQVGGDIGWQSRVTLVPNYYEAVVNMKVGEITGLIETQFGFHVIKLTGRRSFENANKRQIRAAVFDEKRKQVFNDYFERMKKSYPIKENKGLLK
ncbi:peptidylprolyl isomerase [Bdellovibrio bacteriovorus]|uniref:peptidylprolyl isomerase n=1 Tax=Bdellovibrio bacteriovorus TaxID=959 RepID=UPI00345B8B08